MIANTRIYGGGYVDESVNPSLLDGFIEGIFEDSFSVVLAAVSPEVDHE